MVVRGAAAYSPFHRSKTHLVYTTDDLRIGFVDQIHFFGRTHPESRAYALPIGKVGLGSTLHLLGAHPMKCANRHSVHIPNAAPSALSRLRDHHKKCELAPGRPITVCL